MATKRKRILGLSIGPRKSSLARKIAQRGLAVAAIGAAGRRGVLVKGGAVLEALASARIVALDKTGTLTRNDPRITEVICAQGSTAADVLAVAAGLEARSEHPLARAILADAPSPLVASDVQAVPGSGVVGRIGGALARLGRAGFVGPGELLTDVARLLQQVGVVAGEPRLRMLATIQEYAWHRLLESGHAEAVRDRHAEFFCHLAEAAETG